MSLARQILLEAYQSISDSRLNENQETWLKIIIENAESHKAILAVVVTSLTKKIDNPAQDIRQHKVELANGYSGRSYDFNHITPFLQEFFPRYAMAESGWLTRSVEQVHPFTFDFPGKIRNVRVKEAFLEILNDVESNQADASLYLRRIFSLLLEHQKSQNVILPILDSQAEFSILEIVNLLEKHFFEKYQGAGASRLPVIALYSLYQLLMQQQARFQQKILLPLKSHTTSDIKSASLGDIELVNSDGSFFEVVEVKHQKLITLAMLRLSYEKFKHYPIKRYYLLTTSQPETKETQEIFEFSENIRKAHGCQVIVNGLVPSLKYYLRLLDTPQSFIASYTQNLATDYEKGTDIKQVHLEKWLSLLSSD